MSELRRLRKVEEENARLKRLVADLSLDKHMLLEALRKESLRPARRRFGYQRIWVLLRREGRQINRKRVRRLYRLNGLQLRMRVWCRKHIALHRGSAPIPIGPQERWSMDFVHNTLAYGRPGF